MKAWGDSKGTCTVLVEGRKEGRKEGKTEFTWKKRIHLEALGVHTISLTRPQIYFKLTEQFIVLM